MTVESIRPSEEELLVFISSRQDDELSRARALAIETVDNFPGMRVSAFEDAPASSEAARDRYIRNAEEADFVIWLVGSTTRQPIVEEIDACLRTEGKLLPFLLPATERDSKTQELIERVQKIVTWRKVDNVENLPDHIRTALTDEVVRAVRNPVPWNHDRYLEQKRRESIAHTKRLWTTFGVQDGIADSLANDQSIGNRIEAPPSGVVMVGASQGSGKTLAAHRLYQQMLKNRMEDHLQPIPVFVDARNVNGDFQDHIRNTVGNQGNIHIQPMLVIIDSLDEIGRHNANRILSEIESFTEANPRTAAVVMTRPLPGLKSIGESKPLPECSRDEFTAIVSSVAVRTVNAHEIPFRISRTRNPLFAVIVGTHLRSSGNALGTTPSQMVSLLVQRILEESDDFPEETAELLKKLAVATITSGGPVPRHTVSLREAGQQRTASSRLVFEQGGKFDFTLAVFREWFAARALVERTVDSHEIELNSDGWIVPLSIAINSGTEELSCEIMEAITTRDPGIASLVLEEVKHNWSSPENTGELPPGTALEIGHAIRQAMTNWKEGLGPLMSALGVLDSSGNIPTLGVTKGQRFVNTSWYRGERELTPVIELPGNHFSNRLHNPSSENIWDWPASSSRIVEDTRVWQWTITHDDLSKSLSGQLETFQLALDSPEGFYEFAYDFAKYFTRDPFAATDAPSFSEVLKSIDECLSSLGVGRNATIMFSPSQYTFTVTELELFREKLSAIPRNGSDIMPEPWPGPDKPWPEGRAGVVWFELYTAERLLQRTNAIFNAALRIYNDIVERWFPTFNKRNQMSYTLPFRMRGELQLPGKTEQYRWRDASVIYWTELANSAADSGIFFELGSEGRTSRRDRWSETRAIRNELVEQGMAFHSGWRVLPANEPRQATRLAHEWLKSDLKNLNWL